MGRKCWFTVLGKVYLFTKIAVYFFILKVCAEVLYSLYN
jgi:hypothetical protein